MYTFPDLIERFGGAATMAPAIGASANTIRQWASRGSIPGRHWKSIIDAAQRLGIEGVTADKLAELASPTDPRPDGAGEANGHALMDGAAPLPTARTREVADAPDAPFCGPAVPAA